MTFYSVAQHCIRCSELVTDEFKLAALMHDASEAYLMDIPSPIKHRLINYTTIENNLMTVIAKKFGFVYPLHDFVKEVDKAVLELEWKNIVIDLNTEWVIHSPEMAKYTFMKKFEKLTK